MLREKLIKREKHKCWLLRIAEDTLLCFQSAKFSKSLLIDPNCPRRLSFCVTSCIWTRFRLISVMVFQFNVGVPRPLAEHLDKIVLIYTSLPLQDAFSILYSRLRNACG